MCLPSLSVPDDSGLITGTIDETSRSYQPYFHYCNIEDTLGGILD